MVLPPRPASRIGSSSWLCRLPSPMPEPPELPPIAAAPISVALLVEDDADELEAVVGDWAGYLDTLARDYEILLADGVGREVGSCECVGGYVRCRDRRVEDLAGRDRVGPDLGRADRVRGDLVLCILDRQGVGRRLSRRSHGLGAGRAAEPGGRRPLVCIWRNPARGASSKCPRRPGGQRHIRPRIGHQRVHLDGNANGVQCRCIQTIRHAQRVGCGLENCRRRLGHRRAGRQLPSRRRRDRRHRR